MEEQSAKLIFEPSEEDLVFAAGKKKSGRTRPQFNLAVFNYLCLGVLVIVGAGCLALSNKLISRGFVINGLQGDIDALSQENRQLELNAMNLQSYNQVNERIANLGMVAATDVEYLEVRGGEMARR